MTEGQAKKPLSKRHEKVLNEYLVCFVQWKAYQSAHPDVSEEVARTSSSRLFANANFKAHLAERMAEVHMSADEALKLQADIARNGLGTFFKVSDEWTFYPLPTSEILDQVEVIDDSNPEKPVTRINYRERRVVVDLDKVMDPTYSRLIKKFSMTRKGVNLETHPADAAQERILKVHGRFKDAVDITSAGQPLTSKMSDEERMEQMKKLAQAIVKEMGGK
jgi:hypothetical protein